MNTKELFGKEVLDVNANRVGKIADMDSGYRSHCTWYTSYFEEVIFLCI